jgi:ribosome-associated protein
MPRKKTQPSIQGPGELAAKKKALRCAKLAIEKKAYGTMVLNVGTLSSIAEYFVICSGRSTRQTRAISDHIKAALKEKERQIPLGVEGTQEGVWILLDYDDVVVHVFYEPTRAHYALETIWSDAPVVRDRALAKAEREALSAKGEEETDWED